MVILAPSEFLWILFFSFHIYSEHPRRKSYLTSDGSISNANDKRRRFCYGENVWAQKNIRTFYNENHQKLLDSIQSKSKQNKAKTIKEKAKVKKCIWKRMLITNRGRCLITYKKTKNTNQRNNTQNIKIDLNYSYTRSFFKFFLAEIINLKSICIERMWVCLTLPFWPVLLWLFVVSVSLVMIRFV